MKTHTLRYSVYGVLFIAFLAAAVTLSIMEFNRDFTASTSLTLRSSRAGLLLDEGSPVKMRGVTIGRVASLRATPDGAKIDLDIAPSEFHLIPTDVQAQIVPPTVFGGKYVQLDAPSLPGVDATHTIAAGATIDVDHVTVEIDNTFDQLMQVLDVAKPKEVNDALNALATALQGRGNEAGQLLTKADDYLRKLNPELDSLQRDLPIASSVLTTYSNVTPNLIRLARNAIHTSDALQANRSSFDAMLVSLTTFAKRTTTFVNQNKRNLLTTLDLLQPTAQVLAEYSPEFPCFFKGLAGAIPIAENALGNKYPGLGVLAQFLPPEEPYKYPHDLSKIGVDTGPHCYGLPNIPNGKQLPHYIFNDGPDPYARDPKTTGFTPQSLFELLFGPIS